MNEDYEDIPAIPATELSYGDGSALGGPADDTSEFERGGGMRLNIDTLLAQKRSEIADLRARLGPSLPDKPEYDDVFLLRYCLTWEKKGGLAEAERAVRATVQFRTQNAQVLAEIRRTGVTPNEENFLKFQTTGYAGSLAGIEPLYIVRTVLCNLKGLMTSMKEKDVADFLLFSKEVAHAQCDQMTRKTRQLVKMITVIDMQGFSMFGGDPRFYKALGDSSKRSADLYPQLLGKTVLINTPSFLRVIWSTFSLFMPKSALEKTTVCPATNTALATTPDATACPFIRKWCGQSGTSTLPDFLGGQLPCPAELKPRSECSNALIKITVRARSTATVEVMVPAPHVTAAWELLVEDYGVDLSAALYPEGGGAPIEVLAKQKIKSDSGLASGTFALPCKGTLVLTFDNSYSILRSKTFNYKIDVSDKSVAGAGNLLAGLAL